MIEGLKVQIVGAKLQTIIREKAEGFQKKAARLAEMLRVSGAGRGDINANVTAMGQMEDRVAEHQSRATELLFVAEHLNVGEVYQLDNDDLRHIGVLNRCY